MASVSTHVAATLPRARLGVRGWWHSLKREPLAHFLALGALLFIAAHLLEQSRQDARRQITVDAALEQRIVQLQQTQNGAVPTPPQLQRLVENYIDDEVMYREALRMGLDADDEIVRRRLIQKMQFLQRDLTVVATPREAELRAYFNEHADRFAAPATVDFEQIYFSPEHGGWSAAEIAARHARAQLGDATGNTIALGDPLPLQIETRAVTRSDAQRLFGTTPIVEALFSTPVGEWSQPVRSGYGWHVVRPLAQQHAAMPPYASVRTEVQAAYLEQTAAAANQQQLDKLRARYTIIRQRGEAQ